MNFFELGDYKKKLIDMFVADEDIVDLVMPILDDIRFEAGDNFLGGQINTIKDGVVETVDLKGHCFEVPFIYSSVTDARNCICLDNIISGANGEAIKEMTVTIEIMCHKTNLRLDSTTNTKYYKKGLSGDRLDMIVQKIGLLIEQNNKEFGLGKFKLKPNNPMKSYYPNENFFGKVLIYTCDAFMTDYAKRSLNGD